MRATKWMVSALSFVVLASVSQAQRGEVRERTEEARRRATEVLASARVQFSGNPADAVLGINTASSGERDTLGLLVTSVHPNSPADRAGIEEGNRIASVNGVNLRLAREDAGERDMQGMTTRRLVRELQKVKAGDPVELSVWKEGRYQTVRAQTVAREDLEGQRRTSEGEMQERAVVGLTLQTTSSVRDTLGPMVVRVASGGPAERAGIVEGDRVQSVNGTSLRVSREDAEEPMVGNAKVNRFSRILRDLRSGESVELVVYSGGQTRTVRITTAKASEVYGESGATFFYRGGDGAWGGFMPVPPMPPSAPRILRLQPTPAPVAPAAPQVRVWSMGVI
ncbi:MAG TPA: PDZ domain-containing protein [Gemmatimonadaceae bacterium]|nr:PDZ domain-containing protein [Gemmatimonadaceae bacterium]